MKMYKKIAAGLVGSIVLLGTSHAAMVTIAGHNVNDQNYASSVTEKTGSVYVYDVGNTGVTSADEAAGGSIKDGISCATDGCSFEVNFNGGIRNEAGNDVALFGVGVGGGTEKFDLKINGNVISGLSLNDSGVVFDVIYGITYLEIDLSAFGVLANDVVSKIEVMVNPSVNAEEFSLFVNMNDVAVPLPAAVWLFGSVLAIGGAAGRRRRALKAAKV